MYKIATLNKISPVGLGELTDAYEITEQTDAADAIIVRSFKMHEMEFGKDLKAIARAGAGTNNIPVDRCAEEGIVVFNTPGGNANSVAELAVGAMLEVSRNMPAANIWANGLEGDVAKAVEKGKSQFAGHEIAGKKIAVIGLGHVGKLVANKAAALGMHVSAYVRTPRHVAGLQPEIEVFTDLDPVIEGADFVSIHVPSNADNKGMVNAEMIDKMKDGAIFLNFARADLVDEPAMLAALKEGKLSRYVTDFPNENLVGQEGVQLLPHLGASTEESEERCAAMAVKELREYMERGNIVNSVNFPGVNLGDLPQGGARLCLLGTDVPTLKSAADTAAKEGGAKVLHIVAAEKKGQAACLADISEPQDAQAMMAALEGKVARARLIG
jgi:D-3-phosphoglycerate dehydrogenase